MRCPLTTRCPCTAAGELSPECESRAELAQSFAREDYLDGKYADMAAADDFYGREDRHYGGAA